MLGLPISSLVVLFIIPGLIIAAMFYYSRKIKKGTWD